MKSPKSVMSNTACQRQPCSTQVTQFKPEVIPAGSNILVCGRRSRGKTHLILDLCRQRHNSLVIVFAGKYVAWNYKKVLPHNNVLEGFSEDKLNTLLSQQLSSEGESEIVVVFDDVAIGDNCLMTINSVRDIVKYGSSLKITAVFGVQHAGVYDETFRRNVDYVFMFNDNLLSSRKTLYQQYGDNFDNFDDFINIYDQCTTQPHRCLVIDYRSPWSHKLDHIYWYQSPPDLDTVSANFPTITWSQEQTRPKKKFLSQLTTWLCPS